MPERPDEPEDMNKILNRLILRIQIDREELLDVKQELSVLKEQYDILMKEKDYWYKKYSDE